MLHLIEVAVSATGGIFLTVAISGLLSALLTLGALELFFRESIQRKVLNRYFQSLWRHPEDFVFFLSRRYGKLGKPVEYADRLQKLGKSGELVPALAKMEERTFYQLHYRQLCGQLASVIANEGLHLGSKGFDTPLSDLLAFIAERRGKLPSRAQPTAEPPGEIREHDDENDDRFFLELALRQVDVIQAELGSQINQTVYGYTTFAWVVFYLIVLVASWVDFSHAFDGGWISAFLSLVSIVAQFAVAFVAALLLAVGTAVFSGVAFAWLDRMFTAK